MKRRDFATIRYLAKIIEITKNFSEILAGNLYQKQHNHMLKGNLHDFVKTANVLDKVQQKINLMECFFMIPRSLLKKIKFHL
jgi:hypothetical protein